MAKTLHWVAPCPACKGTHQVTQPMPGDANPYLGKKISFVCPVTGIRVTVLGNDVRLEKAEPLFPPLAFTIEDA